MWQLLRRDTVLRIFKLNTGQDDHAIMFMDDYLNQAGGFFFVNKTNGFIYPIFSSFFLKKAHLECDINSNTGWGFLKHAYMYF